MWGARRLRGVRPGQRAPAAGEYERAEQALDSALAAGPVAAYYRERADVRQHLGKYAEAVSDCDRALEITLEDDEALEYRAQAYMALGQFDRALQDLDVSLEIDGTDAWSRYLRGYVRCSKRDFDAALEDEKLALEYDPLLGSAWGKAGYLLLELERPAEALPYLTMAMELISPGPERKHYLFCLAVARYHLRDDAVLKELEAYVAACGAKPKGWDVKGVAWARKVRDAPPAARWDHAASIPH